MNKITLQVPTTVEIEIKLPRKAILHTCTHCNKENILYLTKTSMVRCLGCNILQEVEV